MTIYKYSPEQVNIPFKRLREQGFLPCDIEVHKELFSYDGFRRAFGDENGFLKDYDLKFVGPKTLPMAEIVSDSEFECTQIYRAGANPQGAEISKSIQEEGYCLREMLPAVIYNPEEKVYYLSEGRTRKSVLSGVPNMLVNVYALAGCKIKASRFGMLLNTIGYAKGFAKAEDVTLYLTSQVEKGMLEQIHGTPKNVRELKAFLEIEMKAVNMRLPGKKLSLLINQLMHEVYNQKELVVFSCNEEVQDYAVKKFGLKDDDESCYIFVPPDAKHGDDAVNKKRNEMIANGDNRKLKVIYYESDPSIANPVRQFKEKMMRAKAKTEKKYQMLGQRLFKNTQPKFDYDIVGAIPYVVALNNEDPINKLIQF